MALTSDIANLSTTTTSVNVPRIATSGLTLVGSSVDQKTGVSTSLYRLPSGDSRYPLTLTMKVQEQNGVRRCSVNVQTFVAITDDVSGLISYFPINTVFAFNCPNVLIDLADLGTLLGNTFGFLLGTVTTGSPDWKQASNLLFGVPAI